MATSSQIPMSVQGPQFEGPLNALAKAMQIQAMQKQAEAQDFQMQQARQGAERQNRLSQLLGGFTPEMSPDQQAAALTRGGYLPEAQTVTKTASEAAKLKREAEAAQISNVLKKIELGGQILGSVKDEASYQRARQIAPQAGFNPWPETYDPNWVAQQVQQGMSLKERAEAEYRKRQDETTRRGQDLTAQNAAARLAQDRENATQGVTYQADEQGNLIALPTKLPAGAPAVGRVATDASGAPIAKGAKPLTDAQSKAALFGARMQEANKVLDELSKAGTETSIPGSRSGFGVGPAINVLSSANQQKLDQAKRDFINATLRRESGAVIADSEFNNAEKQYFPQIGDTAGVIAQKKKNREVAMRGILAEVPENRRDSLLKEITNTTSTNAPSVGTVQDGYKFKGGNPADPKNWEKQ